MTNNKPNQPTAPEQKWQLLRKILPKRLQPLARGVRKRLARYRLRLEEPYKTVYPYTQASMSKQRNLVHLCQLAEERGLHGAIVECGVLDGGTSALMAYSTSKSGRPVHMFDSWEGLPAASEEDGEDALKWAGDVVGSPKRVLNVMRLLGVPEGRLHFHKGWFSKTFPQAQIDQIAVMHIDADLYDSVRDCFERWYPKVVPGGFIQIDDYDSFQGCRLAVDAFLKTVPALELRSTGIAGNAYFIEKPR